MNALDYKLPPSDVEAERATLGSLILAGNMPKAVSEIRRGLTHNSFSCDDHQTIFAVICKLLDDGKPVDLILLKSELEKRGELEEVGGVKFLVGLAQSVPDWQHGAHYASVIRPRGQVREIISHLLEMQRKCGNGDADPAEIAQEVIDRMSQVQRSGGNQQIFAWHEVMGEVLDQIDGGGVPLLGSGIRDLDAAIGGFGRGEYILAAGRSSMGKSILAKQIAKNWSKGGLKVGIISPEESRHKIVRNAISSEAGIANHEIRRGRIGPSVRPAFYKAVESLSPLPCWIADQIFNVRDVCAAANMMVAQYGVEGVIIDHLHILDGSDDTAEMTKISRTVKHLVKRLNVYNLTVCQLNRELEKRDNKRPRLSDLRQSGSLEQDADGVVLIHREDYYHLNEHGYEPDNIVELITAKWRDASRDNDIKLKADLPNQRFLDLDPADQFPDTDPF